MATQFKRFAAGKYTDQDITDFMNSHIIERDLYQPSGDIYVYYREVDDIGTDPLTHIETLNRSLITAEKDVFDAELGLIECAGNKADIDDQISQTTPNEKEKWDALQRARESNDNSKIMHDKTIELREKQIFDLREKHQELVKQVKA